MSKKLKRVRSGHSHRWKKGHSCESNPGNAFYREEAKSRFFQKIEDSGLTVEALAQHTAGLAVGAKNDILTADPEDDQSVGKSFNTFATKFTTCTNPAFEKFFQNGVVSSEVHMNMLAVHATAQKYIEVNGLPDTCTSYLCAFVDSLEGVKENEDYVAATLSMMSRVIRKVSPEVLRFKYGEIEKLLSEIFINYVTSENRTIIINVIGCLSVLIRSQDRGYWQLPFAKNLLRKILEFTIHENVKVRKCAQYNVSAILKGSCFVMRLNNDGGEDEFASEDEMDAEDAVKKHFALKPIIEHPAAEDVANFILEKFKLATSTSNGKMTLYLLVFLQQVIVVFPKHYLEKCCSKILGIMHIGDSTVNGRALKVLQTLFTSDSTIALEKDVNEALLNALIQSSDIRSASLSKTLKLVPSMNNEPLAITWMTVVAAGIINLTRLCESSGLEFVAPFLKLLTSFWRSDSENVHEKIFFTVEYLLDECFVPIGPKLASNYAAEALLSFETVEEALSLKYERAWPYVFRTLAVFYRIIGKYHCQDMISCLKNLADMSENIDTTHRPLLENVIGVAIQNITPEEVINAVPIQITGNIKVDEKYFWLLPLFKKYVKGAKLSLFVSYFVVLSKKCLLILQSQQGKSNLLVRTYETIERQIWSLFPSFALEATDIEEAMIAQGSSFAKLVCDNIKLREDIRLDLLAGLRNIIAASKDEPSVMIRYSKNYLPVLFNIYLTQPRDKAPQNCKEPTVEGGQRLTALSTIQTYLQILPPSKSLPFFQQVMKRFQEATPNSFNQRALLSLARSFVPYINAKVLYEILLQIEKYLKETDMHLQKVTYRWIQDVLSLENESGEEFFNEHHIELIKLFLDSKLSVASNAKAARLKCFSLILCKLPLTVNKTELTSILENAVFESISCCSKNNSVTTRKGAFCLLADVGMVVQRLFNLLPEETFVHCFNLLPKLDLSSSLTSNVVIALTVLSNQYKDLIPVDILMENIERITKLLPKANRDVIKSCLAFIKLMLKHYQPAVMSDLVDGIVEGIVKMSENTRKKFRLKIRDILSSLVRKYGGDRIKALVPRENPLQKMLVNIVKAENRRKRMKKSKEDQNDQEEEEEEKGVLPSTLDEIMAEIDKDIEEDHKEVTQMKKKKSKSQTWIVEDEDDIVDLLDPSSGANIKNKRPKTKRVGFEDQEQQEQTEEEKYGFKIDKKTNKIIIRKERNDKKPKDEEEDEDEDMMAFEDLNEIVSSMKKKTDEEPKKEIKKRKRTTSEASENSQIPVNKKLSTQSTKRKFNYGSEYKSKKAGGDVMNKGGMAPFAYVQFSKQKLNKRKRSKFDGQYKSLVKGGRIGKKKGTRKKNGK